MNGEFEHIAYHDLIVKYLTGEATAEEKAAVDQWVQEKEANRKVFNEYQRTWDNLGKVQALATVDVNAEWKRMEAVIDRLDNETKTVNMQPKKALGWMKVAAALVVLVMVAAVWRLLPGFMQQELATLENTDNVQLADGSSVTLNAYSELNYPEKFEGEVRKVVLEGEAFFEVEPNPEKPFIITAQGVNIEVLGTSFNVKAYEQSNGVEIVVKSGKVAVYRTGEKDKRVILQAGEKAIYAKASEKLVKGENQNPNFLSWKTKRFVFEDTQMQDVVRLLNNVYHTKLVIRDQKLKECPVTVTFQGDSLESILKVLESTLELKSRKRGDTLELSGKGC